MCFFLGSQLAMRALDFDVKKADVKNLMEDHTKDGNTDEVDMDEFMEIRKFLINGVHTII